MENIRFLIGRQPGRLETDFGLFFMLNSTYTGLKLALLWQVKVNSLTPELLQ